MVGSIIAVVSVDDTRIKARALGQLSAFRDSSSTQLATMAARLAIISLFTFMAGMATAFPHSTATNENEFPIIGESTEIHLSD